MRSLRTFGVGLVLAVTALAAAGCHDPTQQTASVRAERASSTDAPSPVLARTEAPLVRMAPVVVTAAIAAPAPHDRQHQRQRPDGSMPFEYLAAFAAIGATTTKRSSRGKSGGTKSRRSGTASLPSTLTPAQQVQALQQPLGDPNRVVKEAEAPPELTPGQKAAAAPNSTINQDRVAAEFNRRSSIGASSAAAIPSSALPDEEPAKGSKSSKKGSKTGKSGTTTAQASRPQRFDETVPGGRYKGTDGKFRNAHGELLEDQDE